MPIIDLYYWPTPNGHKITMFLEEADLDYQIVPVDIGRGEQFKPDFLAIIPNNRTPAIIDQAPLDDVSPSPCLSRARFSFTSLRRQVSSSPATSVVARAALEWLFWQVGGLGPMAGQNHHFSRYAPEKLHYAIERYVKETNRLYGVLDRRLTAQAYLAGPEYSIADIAAYPWIVPWQLQSQDLTLFPALARWFEKIAARPGTVRAYARAEAFRSAPVVTEESRKLLFGQTARTVG